jgi:hypothetical protein
VAAAALNGRLDYLCVLESPLCEDDKYLRLLVLRNLKENQPAHTGSPQPSSCSFNAKTQGGLGKINAEGLERVSDSYVNGAYSETDVTLNVDVQGGVGEINLEVV